MTSEQGEIGTLSEAAWERAIDFINSQLPDTDVLKSLETAKRISKEVSDAKYGLEKQLTFITSEAPSRIEKAVKDAEVFRKKVGVLRQEQDQLFGDVSDHLTDVSPLVKSIATQTSQINELEKYTQYLYCISQLEDLSSDIQSALLINSVERSVEQFAAMVELANEIAGSKCRHLVGFARSTVVFWYKILLEKLVGEFDEALTAWQWPFIVTTVKSTPVVAAVDSKEKLASRFCLLAQLQLPAGFLTDEPATSPFVERRSSWRPLLLPIQQLLKPFQKRFLYHFCGNKKTNNINKPEWYFTQILTWIRDHREFLQSKIQPELDKIGLHHLDIVVEFSRGLVVLAIEKLLRDMPEMLVLEATFAHVVDETLAFHRDLVSVYGYPDSQPGCLDVLTEPEPFKKWLYIEKKFALEKMDEMLSSETAWRSQYKDITDVDEFKVSECGETFMMLMMTITDRYKQLSSTAHRFDFLQLQLELLDDYRIRLIQVRNSVTPLQQQYCAILNTVSYITDIVRQWANLPFFVKMQFYKYQMEEEKPQEVDGEVADHQGAGYAEQQTKHAPTLQRDLSIAINDAVLDRLDVSLFEEMIVLFELMKDGMLSVIGSYVFDDVKARSRPYRKDKWLALPSQKDYISMALSSSACEMLSVLKDHLNSVEQLLSRPLYNRFWQHVATELNTFLYKEVILENQFNEGGAIQLQFDMTRNLFPLFSAVTGKPENYFKDVKEACIVLALSAGSALLLKDVLHRALHDAKLHPTAAVTDPIAALHDIGVYRLAPEDVELLLSLRVDLGT